MAGYMEFREESKRVYYQFKANVIESRVDDVAHVKTITWPRTFTSKDWAIDKAVELVNENPVVTHVVIEQVVVVGTTVD